MMRVYTPMMNCGSAFCRKKLSLILRDESVFGGRILDTTQIRRLIPFSLAADVTIQHFTCRAVAAREGGTNHDSEANV
jgi:hypothetical protein